MKLVKFGSHAPEINLRHSFAIGPLGDSYLFNGRARLYYCTRCRWNFLVSGSRVAVIDDDGRPISGEVANVKFQSFEDGPCPVLQGLIAEFTALQAAVLPVNGNNSGTNHADGTPRPIGFRSWLHAPGSHRRNFRWQA
ncbi:MAG TPA: hypothetical protein VMF50_01610 [Candidatus Binataceae bacterium]|nr:hypothetical protein [Candidatus Binataceae bacterium]